MGSDASDDPLEQKGIVQSATTMLTTKTKKPGVSAGLFMTRWGRFSSPRP
jgi:hypothetical protein